MSLFRRERPLAPSQLFVVTVVAFAIGLGAADAFDLLNGGAPGSYGQGVAFTVLVALVVGAAVNLGMIVLIRRRTDR